MQVDGKCRVNANRGRQKRLKSRLDRSNEDETKAIWSEKVWRMSIPKSKLQHSSVVNRRPLEVKRSCKKSRVFFRKANKRDINR